MKKIILTGGGTAGQGARGLQSEQKAHPFRDRGKGARGAGERGTFCQGGQLPAPALRRAAAARGHRPGADAGAGHPLL